MLLLSTLGSVYSVAAKWAQAHESESKCVSGFLPGH